MASFGKILDWMCQPIIRLYEKENSFLPPRADVIVGLGTGLMPDGTCSPQTKANAQMCAVFFREKLAPRVIFAGGYSQNGITEAGAMAKVVTEIPREFLILEVKSKNTWQNAMEVKKIVDKDNNWRKIVIVCNYIHSRRALAVFKKVFEGYRYRVYVQKTYSPHISGVAQKHATSAAKWLFTWEIPAWVLYKWKGWV